MGTSQIRIAIVDDHILFREGIKFILSTTKNMEVVAEYKNGIEFTNDLSNLEADVVLMDISMPEMDGLEATRIASEKKPSINILAFSMHCNEEYYHKMVNAGAKGFILKETRGEELIMAIEKLVKGENYFSQELLRKIIFNYHSKKSEIVSSKEEGFIFTKRELEVLGLLCKGMTNAEIAEFLYLSSRTIEGHRANLLKKTGTKNTTGLIMYALKTGLIPL